MKIIAKTKQLRTIAESLVRSCCRKIVKIIINESAVKEVEKVSQSDISRRIDDISDEILSQLKESLMKSKVFALQLDESSDIQGKTQLLANIRYVENNSKQENFLFCREIAAHTTGEKIYNITAIFFEEEELEWSNCISVCTDRAP